MRVASGASLLEFQVYLFLSALSAVFLAQLFLLFPYTYDRVVYMADRQLMKAAAYRMVTHLCDQAMHSNDFELGVYVRDNRLMGQIDGQYMLLLENVGEFTSRFDRGAAGIRGAWLVCDGARWYRARRERVFSCSLLS